MQDDKVSIACAIYQAYESLDRMALDMLLSEDFRFTSPADYRIDRADYLARIWPQGRSIHGFEFVHLAADGDCVFVTFEVETKAGRRFRNTEVITVRNGLIHEIEAFTGWSVPHEARKDSSAQAA